MAESWKTVNINQIKKIVDRVPVISFDLFDTLVKRDCCKPTELFVFLEQKINQKYKVESHFASKRVQAEIDARNNSTAEEVSLDEIYDELSFKEDSISKVQIRQWEEEYEYMICQWNPFMKPVYEYGRSQGKRIFIITDIYLPEGLIKKILKKLDIQYDALFVSSMLRKMKRNGTLFKEVLKQTGFQPSDILHIGDNKRSDYLIPKRLGMHAIHIQKDAKLNLLINHKLHRKNTQYANLCSFINNHANTHSWDAIKSDNSFDFFSEVGYEAQGPVLYGYVNWLQEQFNKDGIEKAFFLARDGQLMQKAYQKLSKPIVNEYMYASRKALIIPSLWMTPSIQEIKDVIFWGKHGTISSFLKKIDLVPDQFASDYTEAGFLLDKIYKYDELWENPEFLEVFEKKIKRNMIVHSHEAYNLLLQYLKQIDFSGKVAMVDIGWFGHMQGALERIVREAHIPVEIYGYYLGLRPESTMLNHFRAKGYLFDNNHHEEYSKLEESFNSIVEMLFTADHGTTKGYKVDHGHIVPILGKWEYDRRSLKKDYDAILACQKGALSFIDDIKEETIYASCNMDSRIIFANLICLGIYPSKKEAKLFGSLHFLDDYVVALAKTEDISFYLLHPKNFISDFREALWRMGFLVYTFGEQIPHSCLYNGVKKMYTRLRKKKD